MGHREDLLAGAKRCLYERGYARTTARDIVAASNTNLASIGYHFGSKEALMNEALFEAIGEWGQEIEHALGSAVGTSDDAGVRFETYWTKVLESFGTHRQLWAASFEVFAQVDRVPEIRAMIAEGIRDARLSWAELLQGIDSSTDRARAEAVGSIYQALLTGMMVQWLVDPQHTPSAAALTDGLRVIAQSIRPADGAGSNDVPHGDSDQV